MNVLVLSIIGFILSLKHIGTLHKVIAWGLMFSFFVQLLPWKNVLLVALLIQLTMAGLSMLYIIKESALSIEERLSIGLMGLLITLNSLFRLMHWPFVSLMTLILMAPIIWFIVSSFHKGLNTNKHVGFMFTWFVMAIHRLSTFLH